MKSWANFCDILRFNLKTKNLVVVVSTRFFLNEKSLSKLIGQTLYVVPPELDFPRNLTIEKIDIKNLEKQTTEIAFQEDVDYKFLEGKSLLIDQDIADNVFVENNNAEAGLIGKTLIDENLGEIGMVKDVSGSQAQKLLVVDYKGKEIYVPYVDEIILKIEDEKIFANLPDGLTEINEA